MERYRVFDHTADLGIQVFGRTLRELFAHGAYALFDLMTELDDVAPRVEHRISAFGSGWDDLWINCLREVLYVFHGAGHLCGEFSVVTLNRRHIALLLRGETWDPHRHRIKQEIKAVTYHGASVKRGARRWIGTVIFDV